MVAIRKALLIIVTVFLFVPSAFAWSAKEETIKDDFGDDVKVADYYCFKGNDGEIRLYFAGLSFISGQILFKDGNFIVSSDKKAQVSTKDGKGQIKSFDVEYSNGSDGIRVQLGMASLTSLISVFKQNDSVKLIVKEKGTRSIFNMGEVNCRGFVKDMRCIKGHSFDFGDGICTVCGLADAAWIVGEGLVKVDGGTFVMGGGGESDDNPCQVTLDGFYISDHEVTQKEWTDVMGYNDSYLKGDDLPVDSIRWYEAVRFCNRLSERQGLEPCYDEKNWNCDFAKNGYRLPTEAEWEYAARGGRLSKGYEYSGSDRVSDVAWYESNSYYKSHPVKTKKPNELGLYDMSGNVWEWCNDWYEVSLGGGANPIGPASGLFRVHRGGSWNFDAGDCAVSYRNRWRPSNASITLGFRLARSAQD